MSGIERLDEIEACSAPTCDKPVRSKGLCTAHYHRVRRTGRLDLPTADERFWREVEKGADCWTWLGRKTVDGYGQFWDGGERRYVRAHRWAFEESGLHIPPGLQLDHLCRNRACVNPEHLEAVTSRENTLRGLAVTALNAQKTHCPAGHAYTPDNTYWTAIGRHCRTCRIEANRRWRARRAS